MTGYRGRLEWAHDIHFPVIVKPGLEDGSIGIRFSAVVGSLKELMERIDEVHADFDGPVLIEEYIEGREIYVAVLGNQDPEALPIVELDLSQLPRARRASPAPGEMGGRHGGLSRAPNRSFPTTSTRRSKPSSSRRRSPRTRRSACATTAASTSGSTPRARRTSIECNPNPWLLSTAELAEGGQEVRPLAPSISSRRSCSSAMARYGA